MLLCPSTVIEIHDLPHVLQGRTEALAGHGHIPMNPDGWKGKTLKTVVDEVQGIVERQYLEWVLASTHGRVGKAAEIAGLHPRGLYNKMRRLGLAKEQFKGVESSSPHAPATPARPREREKLKV
jgi:DNA-binding NtrC family response regulator